MSELMSIGGEQAKAVASVAEFGTESVRATAQAGSWLARIIQDVPQDLIGVLGGDWLHQTRQRNLAALEANTAAHLERVAANKRTEPSPSVLVPLLTAAANESREELREIWAALLANAMTNKGRRVRVEFFNVVRQLEPLDALLLRLVANSQLWRQHPHAVTREGFAGDRQCLECFVESSFGYGPNATKISFEALERLNCVTKATANGSANMTAFGVGLVAACEPPY